MKSIRRSAMCFFVGLTCASLQADPVQLTVTVRDPDGNPVPGAGVQYFFESDSEPIPAPALMTDAGGQITTVIDTPAPPPIRGMIVVDSGSLPGETFQQAVHRWRALGQLWQFPVPGTTFEINPGQAELSIEIDALPVVELTGVAQEGAGPVEVGVLPLSGYPSFGSEAPDGVFSIRAPRMYPLVMISRSDRFQLELPPLPIPAGMQSVDLGEIQFEQPMGLLAGHTTSDGQPATKGIIHAMRLDGTVLEMLFSDGERHLDGDFNAPGPDPDNPDEGIEIPAGEYVLFKTPNFQSWTPYPVHAAITFGVAQAQLDALPRVTVPEDGRIVISIDIDQLEAATKALLDEVLGL